MNTLGRVVARPRETVGPPGRMQVAIDREHLTELLDSLPEDRLALAETALTALAMPDDESVLNADREALAGTRAGS